MSNVQSEKYVFKDLSAPTGTMCSTQYNKCSMKLEGRCSLTEDDAGIEGFIISKINLLDPSTEPSAAELQDRKRFAQWAKKQENVKQMAWLGLYGKTIDDDPSANKYPVSIFMPNESTVCQVIATLGKDKETAEYELPDSQYAQCVVGYFDLDQVKRKALGSKGLYVAKFQATVDLTGTDFGSLINNNPDYSSIFNSERAFDLTADRQRVLPTDNSSHEFTPEPFYPYCMSFKGLPEDCSSVVIETLHPLQSTEKKN
ncbi:uncharacterized protein I206_104256 [Kwoniella pini CBS 10737]|uniref:Uncharacterized protein n=1 Tax=Kwoniella pini CBS 10737 TaxID=1296096 RepID=A0A1B9I267_9TREE|nr:uncharacterized protein I206_04168 [Kwoniella pini CBS 10737]OCF49646.1 hypothetical protein I206_04168 [Kwoniella pini CBS 10737]